MGHFWHYHPRRGGPRVAAPGNKIKIYLTGTESMMADIFTKALDKTKFLKCRDYLLTSK